APGGTVPGEAKRPVRCPTRSTLRGDAWRGPADGVGDDASDIGMKVRGVGLVARPEVEDPAPTTRVAAPAAEHFATGEPTDQHEPIRRRDVEELAVHLLFLDEEGLAESGRDR